VSEVRAAEGDLQESADERYRRLIEQSEVGLFQSRTDGTLAWLNSAAARLFGYGSPQAFMEATPDIRAVYVDPDKRTELLDLLERDGGVSGFEYEMKRADGARRWLSITARALRSPDGTLDGFEGTFVDTTERKLFEARLEELDRLKNQFFASASHDLRNPVSVICGIAEVLEARWDQIDDGRKIQMLNTMARSARTVQQLLQRDFDLALIELGELRYELEPFDLEAVVREVVDGIEQSDANRVFAIEVPPEVPEALGDSRRQSQILHNLLSNAVKFSPPGSTITVSVQPSGSMLEVAVSDEGPGIDKESQARLFQRLSRLESKAPGTGLGLYMSRAMVEAQGGEITLRSSPGQGSTFAYTVPRADGRTAA
jgi:PAS domain S-box-containing protein